jgi:hypothetical protein
MRFLTEACADYSRIARICKTSGLAGAAEAFPAFRPRGFGPAARRTPIRQRRASVPAFPNP